MSVDHDLGLWHRLYTLESRYWREVDFNHGRGAGDFYMEDGRFVIGDNVFSGRKKIQEFYAWREQRARTTTRHLVGNLLVEPEGSNGARVAGIISFHQAEGHPPVLESKPAILIADLINECVLCPDGAWRYKSHTLRPVFV